VKASSCWLKTTTVRSSITRQACTASKVTKRVSSIYVVQKEQEAEATQLSLRACPHCRRKLRQFIAEKWGCRRKVRLSQKFWFYLCFSRATVSAFNCLVVLPPLFIYTCFLSYLANKLIGWLIDWLIEKCDSRRILPLSRRVQRQSHFSATVSLFCDIVDRA